MVRYPFYCTLAKEVQSFPGPGLYSGIFIIYLHYHSNDSRRAAVIFYAICLLYVLSTVTFVADIAQVIFEVSNNSICKNSIFYQLLQWGLVQIIATACCDFIAQCIIVRINHCTYHPFYSPKSAKIYRCWIVWGQNIRVVIIPSFLAIAYLGQSIYLHLISRFQFISSTSYLATSGSSI